MLKGPVLRQYTILVTLVCVGLLAALIYALDPVKIGAAIANVSLDHLVPALLAVQVQVILSAMRWRFTARRLGHDIPLRLAIGEYYVSSFLNLILPGGMAGDALRAYRNRAEGAGGWKRPAAAVFLERLSGQFAFLAVVAVGLAVWPLVLTGHSPQQGFWYAFLVLTLVLAGGLIFAFRKSLLPKTVQRYAPLLAAVFWQNWAWLVQILLSMVIVGSYLVTFMIMSDAVGAPLPPIAAITVIPLCLLTMLIPAGLGGWGTREAAAAALWPLFGFTSAQGLSASLLYGLVSLAGAGIPGLLFLALSLIRGRIGRA